MKLILQQGAQSIEYEVMSRDNAPLTNHQAMAVIDYAYAAWEGAQENPPPNPTLAQKVALLLELLGDHMLNAAHEQRRAELTAANEAQVTTELG